MHFSLAKIYFFDHLMYFLGHVKFILQPLKQEMSET